MRWSGPPSPELDQLLLDSGATILDALKTIDRSGQTIAFVTEENGRVIGSLTDGDIRRALLSGERLESTCIPAIMNTGFTAIRPGTGRAEALDLMRARSIGQLPVLDEEGKLVGLHTVHELLLVARRENIVVILAGGLGTRLHPITKSIPKAMVTVAGRPILERIVLHLMSSGFCRIYLAVNHLAHVIEEHFGAGERFGCRIEYLRESRPLGTGGPLSLLKPTPNLPVVVLNGDLVTQCNIGAMLDFHQRGHYSMTVGLKPHALEIPFGVAYVDGDRLVRLEEKPTERRLINAGMYIVSPEAVQLVPKNRAYPITDLLGCLLDQERDVGAYIVDDDWIDVGRHDELLRARGEE